MISKPKTGTSKATKEKGNKARLEQFIEAKRTARTLLEELGLPVPKKVEDFIHIRRAVGKFLAASSFISRNPIIVMELPVQPGHDSKAMLRERVICDERVEQEHVLSYAGHLGQNLQNYSWQHSERKGLLPVQHGALVVCKGGGHRPKGLLHEETFPAQLRCLRP